MAITYLSGGRIQGSSTGTKTTAEFEETFSSTGHTSDDTTVSGWYANDILRLKYDTNNNAYFNVSGAVDILYYDLQHADALNGSNANATNWTLRFKINMTTKSGSHNDGTQFAMGLVSHTGNVSRDFMGIFLLQAHSSGSFVLNGTVNGNYPQNQHGSDRRLGGSSQTLDLASGTDWWVDITRDGDDCITTIYEDEFTGTSHTNTQDVANIADLRYIHFGVYAGNTTFIGTIDDIKFYDGGMTQDEKATITNVPLGTRYEETDTRKFYQRGLNEVGTGWTTSGDGKVSESNGILSFSIDGSSQSSFAYKSLGETAGTTWNLRYKLAVTTDNITASGSINHTFGVTDSSSGFSEDPPNSSKSIYMKHTYHADNTAQYWTNGTTNGNDWDNGIASSGVVTFYVETIMNDGTEITTYYTGSDYSTGGTSTDSLAVNSTANGGTKDKIFLNVYSQTVTGGSVVATISDIIFSNNSTTSIAKKWVERGTAI